MTKIARMLIHIFCNHEWEKEEILKYYYDYSGYSVQVAKCKCIKCGKIQIRKFI